MSSKITTWVEVDEHGTRTTHTSRDPDETFLDGLTLWHKRPNYVRFSRNESGAVDPTLPGVPERIRLTLEDEETIRASKGPVVKITSEHPAVSHTWRDKSFFNPAPEPKSTAPILFDPDTYELPTQEWMQTTRRRLYEQLRELTRLQKRLEGTGVRTSWAMLKGIPRHVTQASSSQFLLTFHRHATRILRCIDTIRAGIESFEEESVAYRRYECALPTDFFPEDPDCYVDEDIPAYTNPDIDHRTETDSLDLIALEHSLKAICRPDPGSIYFNFVQ